MRRTTPYIIFKSNPYDFGEEGVPDSAVQFSIYEQEISRQDILEQFTMFIQALGYPVRASESLQFVDRTERSVVQDAINDYATMHGNVFKKGE
tara:strand:- start:89 stop:367 length:279 start_codon:yes stop_codon:yes gene_type:complete